MATAKGSNAAPQSRGDIAGAIAAKHGLSQSLADQLTKDYEAAIVRAVSAGQEVRLAGFGSFKVSHRAARMGRNPQTGEVKKIAAKKVVRFAPGKAVKDAVNGVKASSAKAANRHVVVKVAPIPASWH